LAHVSCAANLLADSLAAGIIFVDAEILSPDLKKKNGGPVGEAKKMKL